MVSWRPSGASLRFGPAFGASVPVLLGLTLLAGGGGAQAIRTNGWIEGASAVLLVAAVTSHFRSRPITSKAIVPLWLLVAFLLLIAGQLLPLPYSSWHALPGRDLAVGVTEALGMAGLARPLTLDPERTRLFAAGVIVPAAFFLATLAGGRRCQLWSLRVIVGAAVVSAVLGALQVASGKSMSFQLYSEASPEGAPGLFVNRNHQATMLLAGMLACAALIRLEPGQIRLPGRAARTGLHYGWALLLLLALMTLATSSRAGAGLLLLFLPIAAMIALGRTRPTLVLASLAMIFLVLGAVLALGAPELFGKLVARFRLTGEMRVNVLPDLLFTIRQYWPVGSGLGTFDPVFRTNENLDLMTAAYLNHAHNEYLELAIEAGLAGVVLAAAALTWLGARMAGLLGPRSPAGSRTLPLAGASIILLMLLHSLVDYPLRIDGLAALFGVAVAFVTDPFRPDHRRRSSRSAATGRPRFGPV